MLPPRRFVHSGFAEFTDYEGTDTVVRVSISLLAGEQGRKFLEVETRWADSGTVLVNSQPKYVENCEFSDAGRVLASSGHGTLNSAHCDRMVYQSLKTERCGGSAIRVRTVNGVRYSIKVRFRSSVQTTLCCCLSVVLVLSFHPERPTVPMRPSIEARKSRGL